MSRPGDVVWADGESWQRDASPIRKGTKAWWYNPKAHTEALGWTTMATLRRSDDFAWLVKDGIPIVLNALAVYHALDSFADFVAKRDAGAELTAERDALLSRLADVREELEPWGLERLTGRDRTLAEQVHDIRQSWTALRDANRHNMSRLDVVEQQLATAHAEHEKSLTDLARVREDRDAARDQLAHALGKLTQTLEARDASQGEAAKLRKRCEELADELGRLKRAQAHISDGGSKAVPQAYALGREEERVAIVASLRDPNWADMFALHVADHIERCDHLRGEDV